MPEFSQICLDVAEFVLILDELFFLLQPRYTRDSERVAVPQMTHTPWRSSATSATNRAQPGRPLSVTSTPGCGSVQADTKRRSGAKFDRRSHREGRYSPRPRRACGRPRRARTRAARHCINGTRNPVQESRSCFPRAAKKNLLGRECSFFNCLRKSCLAGPPRGGV